MLHLITCHRRVMPRLVELLFPMFPGMFVYCIDFIAKRKPDNSCTRSVTLNGKKGLLFANSCFMKRTLTRNKEGCSQDKTLRFCK